MAWSGGGWGDWHTSSAIDAQCPQGCGRHTVAEAVELNTAASIRKKRALVAAHDRWLHDGKGDEWQSTNASNQTASEEKSTSGKTGSSSSAGASQATPRIP